VILATWPARRGGTIDIDGCCRAKPSTVRRCTGRRRSWTMYRWSHRARSECGLRRRNQRWQRPRRHGQLGVRRHRHNPWHPPPPPNLGAGREVTVTIRQLIGRWTMTSQPACARGWLVNQLSGSRQAKCRQRCREKRADAPAPPQQKVGYLGSIGTDSEGKCESERKLRWEGREKRKEQIDHERKK